VEGAKGEPLAVGRRTRAVPPAIRRALRVRDGGCRFPGCDRSRYVHAHHIKHWADGGETRLDNLVTLCSQHHRQVHEGGYGVRVRDGEIEFTRPDGRVIPMAGRTGLAHGPHGECFRGNTSAQRLAAFNAARGLNIDAHTARCGWGGERMDYNIAIDNLCLEAGYT
ncbi:MAG: HNH endonuclease signature motif containing protein, partial [Gammaproteobacteria bacterium]|nr:HNH endonuclease signature motif containing protein [Gammaproteobacteria bacterium]